MSQAYTTFATIYDKAMALDYSPWAHYILKAYKKHIGTYPTSILDLGCGTGGLIHIMDARRKVGIDVSKEMIREATILDSTTEYIVQDIRKFKLQEKFDLVISTHDTLNYIIEEKELLRTFQLVHKHLNPGGLFLADVTSEYNILKNFADKKFEESYLGIHMLWENNYNRLESLLTSRLRFYEEEDGRLMDDETHLQKYYSRETIHGLLEQAGFFIIGTGSDYANWKETPTASLMTVLAQSQK